MNSATEIKESPDGLWHKCDGCDELVFRQALERNLYICPSCGYYLPVPAEQRLNQIFSTNSWIDLFPDSAPQSLLESLDLADLVSQTVCPDLPERVIAAGEGEISGCSTILTVIHPLAPPQRIHFVTLLIAIRTALLKALPMICVYPNDAVPKLNAADRTFASELSFAEITHLSTEMGKLSESRLPQITVLTDANAGALSTRFPTGDIILAEGASASAFTPTEQPQVAATQTRVESTLDAANCEAFIDCYILREALPERLGKLIGFFAKARGTSTESS